MKMFYVDNWSVFLADRSFVLSIINSILKTTYMQLTIYSKKTQTHPWNSIDTIVDGRLYYIAFIII